MRITCTRSFRPCLDQDGKEYPDYFVAECGDVLSIKSGSGAPGKGKARIRKPSTTGTNRGNVAYYLMCMFHNGTMSPEYVHHLVARAWIGMPDSPELQVNHKDLNKMNNHYTNLEWVTCSENIIHVNRSGISGRVKLTVDQVREIRTLYALGDTTQSAISELFGVTAACISNIVQGRNWGHVA